MKVTAQVITTPTVDTAGTAILLQLDAKRYLFGHLGEGIQRALLQRKTIIVKIGDFFLTGRTEWKNVGGLLGMMLTLADQETARSQDFQNKRQDAIEKNQHRGGIKGLSGSAPTVPESFDKKVLNVHGSDNLLHTLSVSRSYVFRTSMTTNVDEIKNDFKDDFLNVHPMKVYPEGFVMSPEDSSQSTDLSGMSLAGSRKRSFEGNVKPVTRGDIVKSVVSDMFNSSWTMDTMISEDEIPLHDDSPAPGQQSSGPPKRVRAPWPASMVRNLPRSKPSPAALSYFVQLHPQRGKFLPDIAKSLGVKPGPEFRKLTNNESVTTESGRIVTPEECMEPTQPGQKILVLDIPEPSYINPLLSRDELQDNELEATVYWIMGNDVATDSRVQDIIKRWSKSTHILSSPDICPNAIALQGAAKANTRLNMLHPDHFPIPKFTNEPAKTLDILSETIILARPQQELTILPKGQLKQLPIPMTHPDGTFNFKEVEDATDPSYVQLAKETQEIVIADEKERGLDELPGKDVEIITLGTGSAMPSKYRNVSATLIRIPNVGSILFDCGESTLGQLSRIYEPEELQDVLRDIKCVYISHLHADHHLGTAAVLRAWYEAKHKSTLPPPVEMIPYTRGTDGDTIMKDARPNSGRSSPTQWQASLPEDSDGVMWVVALGKYDQLLREYADVEDFGYSWIRFIATEQIREGNGSTLSYMEDFKKALSLKDVQTAKANHCIGAATCAFTFNNDFKFAYSGDTRPTTDFVRIGKGATLLLHEATFDDELQAEAYAKKHSTTSDAVKAGMDMGAKTLMLTHFSQRYPKLPVIAQEGHKGEKMKVALAFDLMRMKVGEIGRFERFIPALRELYKDEEEEDALLVIGQEDGDEENKDALTNKKGKDKKEKGVKKEKKPKQEKLKDAGSDGNSGRGGRGGRGGMYKPPSPKPLDVSVDAPAASTAPDAPTFTAVIGAADENVTQEQPSVSENPIRTSSRRAYY